MKRREFEQLKNKPENELLIQLNSLKDNLWDLKKDLVAGKVKNVRQIRVIKKDIARIMTLLNRSHK